MNKIFKVVWSKARNCYIVVSELAKSRTKSASAKAAALVLAMALTIGGGTALPQQLIFRQVPATA